MIVSPDILHKTEAAAPGGALHRPGGRGPGLPHVVAERQAYKADRRITVSTVQADAHRRHRVIIGR